MACILYTLLTIALAAALCLSVIAGNGGGIISSGFFMVISGALAIGS